MDEFSASGSFFALAVFPTARTTAKRSRIVLHSRWIVAFVANAEY